MRIKIFILLGAIVTSMATSLLGQIPTAVGRRGMVVAGNEVAARFGLNILRRGGNAVDAAIATGFALAVIQPRAGNIGGGGFMVIRLADGTTTTIDFREKAPLGATRDMYVGSDGNLIKDLSTVGVLASGVPGTVRGYGLAHARYGRLAWATLLQESISLADRGFAITYQIHSDLVRMAENLTQFEETARIFYPRGEAPRLNALFRQPDLAATLGRIALSGADEFYTGQTARLLADFMGKYGGLITLADLANYQAVERPALEFDYRDTHIITMPPPSAGGFVLAEILNQWERIDIGDLGYHSAAHIHAMVEAYRRAYADRARFAADPDFVDVPVNRLISDGHAASLWKSVSPAWASASADFGGNLISSRSEGSQTTHISVIDRQGNAVALTLTINSFYGSGMVVEGAGYFLNNEMDDFV
ncbi:MAG: gamma-glutamyltransferase, partial [Candidatus Marinimicrobia bacterium]|nr:gamma-glutamyltransferase [Candidatus Neomarinimicrobiota bacterium]